MKVVIHLLVLFSLQLQSQTYLGITYNNSDPANSTDISVMQKITFTSTDITFLLTDNSTIPKSLSIIIKITFSGIGGESPLPVEIVRFTAQLSDEEVILRWATATEKNNYGFEVGRIRNEELGPPEAGAIRNWEKIGFVKGNGNSNSAKEYSFIDQDKKHDGVLKYRLKQIDNDGNFRYSNKIEVTYGIPILYELRQNYPNPFNPETRIGYSLPIDGFVTLRIFDVLGREIATLVDERKSAGNYEVTFDAISAGSGLASGVYICRMSSANYSNAIKMLIAK